MSGLDSPETLFVTTAFLFQLVLIAYFALRRWRFAAAIRYGPSVYALSLAAFAVSLRLLLGGKSWSLWLGGFLYLVWAIFGYTVEYVKKIEWRTPIRWPIFGPYVFMYLATVMFYWFPLALVHKPLWYIYAALFVVSTFLNVTSHHGAKEDEGKI
ncbi:MAG TPA: hypothetical protein PKH77_28740 [Anaerolineae bacterium]|nr:hypothetical protein [Anaerolineae bacterium]